MLCHRPALASGRPLGSLEDAKIEPSRGYDNPQQPDAPDLRAVLLVVCSKLLVVFHPILCAIFRLCLILLFAQKDRAPGRTRPYQTSIQVGMLPLPMKCQKHDFALIDCARQDI